MTAEVRIINEQTGGEKGRKAQRFELLPWEELGDVAELYAFGAEKYSDHNWRKGFDWSLSYGAMLRHAALFWEGEETDAETGCSHLTSVVFHALALMYFGKEHRALDDRFATQRLRQQDEELESIFRNPRMWAASSLPGWGDEYHYLGRQHSEISKVYICGPMTGHPQFNFPLFDRTAHRLRKRGYTVITPSELDNEETRTAALASPDGNPGSGTSNGETWGDFLSRDVKLLADEPGLEAIVCLPGWLTSRGARLEVFCAGTLCGKRVFLYDEHNRDLGEEITDKVLTMMAEHGEPDLVPEAGGTVEDAALAA